MICKNCKGKGHIMDGAYALAATLSIILIPCLLFDRNDPDGITREICSICKGKGYLNEINRKLK